jgi:hypothetical protein
VAFLERVGLRPTESSSKDGRLGTDGYTQLYAANKVQAAWRGKQGRRRAQERAAALRIEYSEMMLTITGASRICSFLLSFPLANVNYDFAMRCSLQRPRLCSACGADGATKLQRQFLSQQQCRQQAVARAQFLWKRKRTWWTRLAVEHWIGPCFRYSFRNLVPY